MKRRKFIALLGSAVAGWSLSARAQPQETRRVGFVIGLDDVEAQARFASFREGLERRGWIDGRNLDIVARFGAADPDRNQRYVAELIALHPAAIVTPNTSTVIALMKEAPTIPVVIAQMGDPVTLGFAGSVAHPDRNVTGFTDFEPAMATKWLELLREVAPLVKRLVILMEPESSDFYIRALKPAASSLGVELKELRVITGGDAELERTIAAFAVTPNGGLIITPGAVIAARRAMIRDLAARYRLPAIYGFRYYAVEGGLMSYGPDVLDLYRRSASYVDRILRGAKVSELPIQYPTKFELVVNLKSAKALGLTIPEAFLLLADELIE
jgi:putative tryptophan/tyrosine transport system substrate-binding protein